MTTPLKTTVAIVEDNLSLGETLRKILISADGLQCVGIWKNGLEAVKKVRLAQPDVILMDINLPIMSGIEATAHIKQHYPDVQIIIVTVYADHDKIFAALKAGASGYLLKRSTPVEVLQAIQDVLAGGSPINSAIARRIVEAFQQPSEKSAEKTVNVEVLSARESEVIKHLAEGLINKEIAVMLGVSPSTIGQHVKNIYKKLHVHSRVEATNWYRNAIDTNI